MKPSELILKLQNMININGDEIELHVQTCCELQLLEDLIIHDSGNHAILISTEVNSLNKSRSIH